MSASHNLDTEITVAITGRRVNSTWMVAMDSARGYGSTLREALADLMAWRDVLVPTPTPDYETEIIK